MRREPKREGSLSDGPSKVDSAAKQEAASVLNQVIGKKLTQLDTKDYAYTFVATRSLRHMMQTTVSNAMIISSTPQEGVPGTFKVLDQEGELMFEHELTK